MSIILYNVRNSKKSQKTCVYPNQLFHNVWLFMIISLNVNHYVNPSNWRDRPHDLCANRTTGFLLTHARASAVPKKATSTHNSRRIVFTSQLFALFALILSTFAFDGHYHTLSVSKTSKKLNFHQNLPQKTRKNKNFSKKINFTLKN